MRTVLNYTEMLNLQKTLQEKRDERFRAGVWQYLIDHSGVCDNGVFKVTIYIKSSRELWKRIDERIRGGYSRYDVEEEERKAIRQTKAFRHSRHEQANRMNATEEIKRGRNVVKKLALWGYNLLYKYLYENKT